MGPNAIVAATAKLGAGILMGPTPWSKARASVGDYAQLGAGAQVGVGASVGQNGVHRGRRGAGGRRQSGR
ncbi:MAG: hypothetical protein WKG07_19520 [Hymenobacter sp.]